MNGVYPDDTLVASDPNMRRTAIDEPDDVHFAAWLIVFSVVCLGLFLVYLLGRSCYKSTVRPLEKRPGYDDHNQSEEHTKSPSPVTLKILVNCRCDGTGSNHVTEYGTGTSNTGENFQTTQLRGQVKELTQKLRVAEASIENVKKNLDPNEGWQMLRDTESKLRDFEAQLISQQDALEKEQSLANGWKKSSDRERKAKENLERELRNLKADGVSVASERDELREKKSQLQSQIASLLGELEESRLKSVLGRAAAERMQKALRNAEKTIEDESKIKNKLQSQVKQLETTSLSLQKNLEEMVVGIAQDQQEQKARKEIADLRARNDELKKELTEARNDDLRARNDELQKELTEARNEAIEQSQLRENQLTAEKEKQQSAEKEVSDLKEQVRKLTRDLGLAETKAKSALPMNKGSTQGGDSDAKELKKTVTDLEKSVGTLTQERDSARNEVRSLNDKIAKLQSQPPPNSEGDLATDLEDAQIMIKDLENTNEALARNKRSLDDQNVLLQEEVKTANKQYEKLKKEMDAEKTKADSAESQLVEYQDEFTKSRRAWGQTEAKLADELARCQKKLEKAEDELEEMKREVKLTSDNSKAPVDGTTNTAGAPSSKPPLRPFSMKSERKYKKAELPDSESSTGASSSEPATPAESPKERPPRKIAQAKGIRKHGTTQSSQPPKTENRSVGGPSTTTKQPERSGTSGVSSTRAPKQREETGTEHDEDSKKKPAEQKKQRRSNEGPVPETKPPRASLFENPPAILAPPHTSQKAISNNLGNDSKTPVLSGTQKGSPASTAGQQSSRPNEPQQPQAGVSAGSTTTGQPQPQNMPKLGAQHEPFKFNLSEVPVASKGVQWETQNQPQRSTTEAVPGVNFADTSVNPFGSFGSSFKNLTPAPLFKVPPSNTGTEPPNKQAPVHDSLLGQGSAATGVPQVQPTTNLPSGNDAPYTGPVSPSFNDYDSDGMEIIGTDTYDQYKYQPPVSNNDAQKERLRQNQEKAAKEEAERRRKFGQPQEQPSDDYMCNRYPGQNPTTGVYTPYQGPYTPLPGLAASGPAKPDPFQMPIPGLTAWNEQWQNPNTTSVQGESTGKPTHPPWGGGGSYGRTSSPPNRNPTFVNGENNSGSIYSSNTRGRDPHEGTRPSPRPDDGAAARESRGTFADYRGEAEEESPQRRNSNGSMYGNVSQKSNESMEWENAMPKTPPRSVPSQTAAGTGAVNAGGAAGQDVDLSKDWLEEQPGGQTGNDGHGDGMDLDLDSPGSHHNANGGDGGNGRDATTGGAAARRTSADPEISPEELQERTRMLNQGWDDLYDEGDDPRLEDDYDPAQAQAQEQPAAGK